MLWTIIYILEVTAYRHYDYIMNIPTGRTLAVRPINIYICLNEEVTLSNFKKLFFNLPAKKHLSYDIVNLMSVNRRFDQLNN